MHESKQSRGQPGPDAIQHHTQHHTISPDLVRIASYYISAGYVLPRTLGPVVAISRQGFDLDTCSFLLSLTRKKFWLTFIFLLAFS